MAAQPAEAVPLARRRPSRTEAGSLEPAAGPGRRRGQITAQAVPEPARLELPLLPLVRDEPRVVNLEASVQRAVGVPTSGTPEAGPVQKMEPAPVAAKPAVPATWAPMPWPAVQAAAEAGPGEAGPGASGPPLPLSATGRSDQDLDVLAHELYDRLRSRLRMELLVDRERAGLVTDLR